MADEAGPRERAEPGDGAAPPGRGSLSRVNAAVLRRINLAGLMALVGLFATADFVAAGRLVPCAIVTGLQVCLALPWSWTVFHLERGERLLTGEEGSERRRLLGAHVVSIVLLLVALGAKAVVLQEAAATGFDPFVGAYRTYVVATFVVFVVGLVGRGSRAGRVLATLGDHPARLMALSFGLVAIFGGFLLTLPVALRHTSDASFVDGLFTATSAVCVTGLVVNDMANTYTMFGQIVILALIQAGGLGIMVLSAFFAIAAGRRLRVRNTAVLAEMIDAESVVTIRRTVRNIVVFTLAIETAGAAMLYAGLLGHPESALGYESPHAAAGAGGPVWWAVFHSVSAFCNAGFSLSHGNLTAFSGAWCVSLTIAALITLGGLGFPVLEEIVYQARSRLARRRPDRLSLHLRVTLAYSAVLTFGGAAVFLVLEWGRTLAERPFGERALASLFQSVSARTAGFNSLDFGAMGAAALVFVAFLMFVGASSGSTGGGIKTSTFAVLLATFRAELRGEAEPQIFDRRVSAQTVRRAVAVVVVSIGFVSCVIFALLLTEDLAPVRLFFEAVSAFATAGLSTGITPALSVAGKLILVVTMFVGRTGPLTLALAVAAASAAGRPRFVLPEGRLPIG